MLNTGQEIALFLINTLFSIYISLIMVRFLLALFRADFYNPISQAIVKITNPPLILLRRAIPPIGKVDTSAIVLMFILQYLELWLRSLIMGVPAPFLALIIVSLLELIKLGIWVFIIALIVQAVMSWVNPGAHHLQNPMSSLLNSLTAPLLRPLRRLLPQTGMIDFSPMLAIILLYVLLIVVNGMFRALFGG